MPSKPQRESNRPRLPFHGRPDDPAPGDEIRLLDWVGSEIGGHIRQVKRVLSEGSGDEEGIFEVIDDLNQRRYISLLTSTDVYIWEELEL